MAAILTIAAAAVLVLMLQALYVAKSGDTLPFFSLTKRKRSPVSPSTKWTAVVLPAGIATALLGLLLTAAARNPALLARFMTDLGNMVGGLILFFSGLSVVLWPTWVIRGLRGAYPTADVDLERPSAYRLTRALGAFVLAGGLLLLSLL